MDPEPLTVPAIHRALAALDAGQLPDVATIRAALLLALTVGPLLVERRHLRAALQPLAALPIPPVEYPDTTRYYGRAMYYDPHEVYLTAGAVRRARALLEEGQRDG